MAREELTTIKPLGRAPARTVAKASPPWAPTPGINKGTWGASARTRSISSWVSSTYHQAQLTIAVPWALDPAAICSYSKG